MGFALDSHTLELRESLMEFMDSHVYPAESDPPSSTGVRLARPSAVVLGRLHSSMLSVTSSKDSSPVSLSTTFLVVVIGTISSSKRPFSCAAAVRPLALQ